MTVNSATKKERKTIEKLDWANAQPVQMRGSPLKVPKEKHSFNGLGHLDLGMQTLVKTEGSLK